MSRSYRKTPVHPNCSSAGQKKYRTQEHKAERSTVKTMLQVEAYDKLPHPREYGNEWSSPRDGKHWLTLPNSKWMRK